MATSTTKDNLIEVSSVPQFTGVASNEETTILSLASIKALDSEDVMTDEADDTQRSPLVIALVIDKSGSMAGQKMQVTKKTMHFIIKELGAKDRLSIIEYDSDVVTSLPLTHMDSIGKERATQITRAIYDGSSTNLSGGLISGLHAIPTDIDSKVVASTLLLTDGLANEGVCSAEGIIDLIQQTQSKGAGRCTINTFGFGADHDAKMLKQIADKGEGMYYFIESEDCVATAFADCLGGLLSVAAQGLEVTIETADGVTLKQVHTSKTQEELTPNKKVRVTLGDLQEGESRDIPFEVTLPVCTATDNFPVATVTFSYFDQKQEQMKTLRSELVIARPQAENVSEEHKTASTVVCSHWNRINVARATEDAVQLADAQKLTEARERLQNVMEQLQQSPAANEELTKNLTQQVQNSISGLASRSTYLNQAQYSMNSFAKAAKEQRCYVSSAPMSESSAAPMWSTSKRANMKSKFA